MGIQHSFAGVAASLVGLLKTRLELFTLEAADEKARLVKLLGMAFAALLFLTLCVLVLSLLVFVYFWPTEHRYEALGALAAVYGIVGAVLLMMVRRSLVDEPPPFSGTIAELGRDAEWLDRVRDAGAQSEAHGSSREGDR